MSSLTTYDQELIRIAQSLVHEKKVNGGVIKEVGCALKTQKGELFIGVSLDLGCGIGFCAEHTAIAQMVTKTNETKIKTIVASDGKIILPPCGRCRELLNLLNNENLDTEVIISSSNKTKLKRLLPFVWNNNGK